MVALHLFGVVIYLILNAIGAVKGFKVKFVVSHHDFFVQMENQLFIFKISFTASFEKVAFCSLSASAYSTMFSA